MVAEDEEGTLRRLNAALVEFTQRIRAHDGRVVKTAGDGLLASFESPVEALRCAIGLQRAMAAMGKGDPRRGRPLRFRIGVNLGDVVVQDGDLLGDGVNVAARLEATADPGGVCLSAAVFDHVAGKVDAVLEDLGEIELRHIPRPVRVYRVEGLGAPEPPPAPIRAEPEPLDGPPLVREPPRGRRDIAGEFDEDRRPAPRRSVPVLAISLVLAALVAAGAIYLVSLKTRTATVDEISAKLGTTAPQPPKPAQPVPPAQTVAGTPPVQTVPATAPPAPTPAPDPKRFAADLVPFVSDSTRVRLRTEYAGAAGPKALAISRSAGTAWFVTAQPSEDEAGRKAVESCLRNAPEPCELYAVGDRVVTERAPPPMPAKPYLPPPAARLLSPIVPERVPLAGPGMRERLRGEYGNAAAHKAAALARTGTIGLAIRRASEDEAVRVALELCGDMTGTACAVLAVDDSFVVPIPEALQVTGLFDPQSLPIPAGDRDRVAQAYAQGGGWKAIALDRSGRLGMALGRSSEAQATADALSECRAQGGQDCLIQVLSIFTVIGR